jgi:PPOX class probable F420-dependent enzyme
MTPTFATTTTVDRDGLLEFVRPRHKVVLITRRADGSPQASPVTAGVDAAGRIVISTYPRRAKATNARHDPRVGVLVLSDDFGGAWVQLDGDAEVLDLPRVGAAGGVLPVHLGRASGLGGVPGGHGRAGQVADPGHADPVGADRARRVPAPAG